MRQVLILADGIEPTRASPTQLADFSACVQQMAQDPRVKTIYGTNGYSSGCALICEVAAQQDALQLAGLLQGSGLSQVRIVQLMGYEQLQGSLRLAQHFAAAEFSDVISLPSSEPSIS